MQVVAVVMHKFDTSKWRNMLTNERYLNTQDDEVVVLANAFTCEMGTQVADLFIIISKT